MKVPFNDTRRQYEALSRDLEAATLRVLRSGWYIHGAELEAFEADFARYCGVSHALGVGNGTDALEIGLRALGCAPGDEVVTVANAGMYTTTACLQVGATPVFADVDRDTLLIDPASVERVLGERTKVVVVTHLYGRLAEVEAIRARVEPAGVKVLEDCAQAHGAARGGKRVGSFGHIAAFSFYPTKNLGALGDGGGIVTNDGELAERVGRLRQYGWTSRFRSEVPFGRNSRMDELQAAILAVKLPHLDAWNERRRRIVARYAEAARGTALRIAHAPSEEFVAHLCVALHPERQSAIDALAEAGIATGIHYPIADYAQPSLAGIETRSDGAMQATEAVQSEILTLPCYAEMTDDEVDTVCEALVRL